MARKKHAELCHDYLEEMKADYEACQEQRKDANEDFRFMMVPGAQWEDWLDRKYDNRARLEVDFCADSVNAYMADWTDNRVAVKYSPDGRDTTEDDSELLQGLYRRDFRRNGGRLAVDNAVFEAAICGVGAFRIGTEDQDKEDPENNDQHVVWSPIYEAHNCVIWDMGSSKKTKEDAWHVNVLEEFDPKTLAKQFPKAKDP